MRLDTLIARLQEYAQEHGGDLLVVLAKDGEGNSFSPLCRAASEAIAVGRYTTESGYEGEFEILDDNINALCLWPTN